MDKPNSPPDRPTLPPIRDLFRGMFIESKIYALNITVFAEELARAYRSDSPSLALSNLQVDDGEEGSISLFHLSSNMAQNLHVCNHLMISI